jgi:hypothetical protein
MICIRYYYKPNFLDTPEKVNLHQAVCDSLVALKAKSRISEFVIQESDIAFPDQETQQNLFEQLRDFASRHKVGLARIFGSRRFGFCFIPPQFILVFK